MNNRVFLEVIGKNFGRFLKRLNDNKIEVYKIKIISDTKMIILVDSNIVDKIEEIKTIYQVNIKNSIGINRYLNILKKNLFLIILIIINFFLVSKISGYLFKIEIIDNDLELREFILKELEKNGIEELKQKKSFDEIEMIKKKILSENKDKIEWLEIVEKGVKYIVKIEERIKNPRLEDKFPSNIVASKEGIVKTIIASNGQVIVSNDTYVKKGDVLISGIIKLNDQEKNRVQAKGDVYAETWYKVTAEQAFHDYIDDLTGNFKKGIKIAFFNQKYKFYKDYHISEVKEKILFKNKILPIYISYDLIREKNYKDVILNCDEALEKALVKARTKINESLEGEEKIISEKQLKVNLKDSKIIVDVLFTVYEKISVEERIEVENVS